MSQPTTHQPDQTACPGCQHAQHASGTECEAGVEHGPHRWHRCLCLNQPGADRACPPQMDCQGGSLGWGDIWYLRQGQNLRGVNGETITPDVLREPAPVSPPADRTGLRDRIAEAIREHYLCTNREEADADGNMPCRCGDWREPGAEVDDENDWESHLADAVLGVLPPAADRAAVLLWAADFAEEVAEKLRAHHEFERSNGALDVMTELRRVAAEEQPTEPWLTDSARIGRALIWSWSDVGKGAFREGYRAAQAEARALLGGERGTEQQRPAVGEQPDTQETP